MDDSGVLNDELMNLVSKRVSSRDKIVELYEKYTKDRLDAITKDQSSTTICHKQHTYPLTLPTFNISFDVRCMKDISEDEKALLGQLKALNTFELCNDGFSS
ncbi:hypothetical protein KSF78_0001538 [Schistosoma japonicum]|nr:hypothetical protein KSF78_0001538 [Schistosoma japonicum]